MHPWGLLLMQQTLELTGNECKAVVCCGGAARLDKVSNARAATSSLAAARRSDSSSTKLKTDLLVALGSRFERRRKWNYSNRRLALPALPTSYITQSSAARSTDIEDSKSYVPIMVWMWWREKSKSKKILTMALAKDICPLECQCHIHRSSKMAI